MRRKPRRSKATELLEQIAACDDVTRTRVMIARGLLDGIGGIGQMGEGKSNKETIRALKRRISDQVCAHLVAGARSAAAA